MASPSKTSPASSGAGFLATKRFDPSDGEKWDSYFEWAKIPALNEVVSLDCLLCSRMHDEITDEDWNYLVCEERRLDYFNDFEYLKRRVGSVSRVNMLGVYRNPDTHISTPPAGGLFSFVGYDLIEDSTQISALTNCGGFPDVFQNPELNRFGLIADFARAIEVQRDLRKRYPEEPHAQCELYALWRMEEQ